MEQYYFVEKNGNKLGPFKLEDLKQQTIYFNDLVWRSDSDQWKEAGDFEELNGIFIIKPPPTPKEQNIAEVNKKFINEIISRLVVLYIVASSLIGFTSYSIAQASWDKYLKETEGKYLGNTRSSNSSGSITLYELSANKRYPYYVPNSNNESAYGYGQSFWFRPFKAFGATVYLTTEEQRSSSTLLGNLILSSFASLSFIFVVIGLIYYAMQRGSVEVKTETTNDAKETQN